MQGRLLPPENNHVQAFPRLNWEREFKYAKEAGLDSIEWIYDVYGADYNPIGTDEGIEQILKLSKQHRIGLNSLCADYFMENHLFSSKGLDEKQVSKFNWLLQQCCKVGIKRVVLPFVDSSSLRLDDLSHVLKELLPSAEQLRIEIHVETDLAPKLCGDLLSKLMSQYLWINYDTGNSASLGYDIGDEMRYYGGKIGSVHIKDRKLGGTTVPLGSGDAPFGSIFSWLKSINYNGDFILQVARDGPEVNHAINNINFIKSHWK